MRDAKSIIEFVIVMFEYEMTEGEDLLLRKIVKANRAAFVKAIKDGEILSRNNIIQDIVAYVDKQRTA